jgi:hypothetical protein
MTLPILICGAGIGGAGPRALPDRRALPRLRARARAAGSECGAGLNMNAVRALERLGAADLLNPPFCLVINNRRPHNVATRRGVHRRRYRSL